MNHYKRHIGDWMKDTAHLSACEEGIYSRLCDQSYSREGPLPADLKVCQKLARAVSKDEREAVKYCLEEFFELRADGWHQKRCDEVISEYQAKAARNREIGRLGGRPGQFVPRETKPTGVGKETQTVSENNPSHKLLAISQEKEREARARELQPDWQPAPEIMLARLTIAGIPPKWTQQQLAAFIAHYRSEGQLRTEAQWLEKFVKWLIGDARGGRAGPVATPGAADDAWNEIRAANRDGRKPAAWKHPQTEAAIEAIGGWSFLRNANSRDIDFRRPQFVAAFNGAKAAA